jgi:hypothetical protein
MTMGHWTAAVLVAAFIGGCNTQRDDAGTTGGTGGTTSGATSTMTDTTMTGGQGGMADTSMGGMHDTSTRGTTGTGRMGSDTTRP